MIEEEPVHDESLTILGRHTRECNECDIDGLCWKAQGIIRRWTAVQIERTPQNVR